MPPEPDPDPSEKQRELLRFIIGFVEANGYQPNIAEMAEHFHVSRSAIVGRLKELQDRGFLLETEGRRERSFRIPHLKFRAYLDVQPTPESD